MTEQSSVAQSWEQQPGEPDEWYNIFRDFFLAQGMRPTIRKAYYLYQAGDAPAGKPRLVARAPNSWLEAARKWEWAARADAFNEIRMDEAKAAIEEAHLLLQASTVEAVKTLVRHLTVPRSAVAAAKEILDRGGIPARSIQDVNEKVTITADQMAEAAKEVEEWERNLKNGSNANDPSSTSSTNTA